MKATLSIFYLMLVVCNYCEGIKWLSLQKSHLVWNHHQQQQQHGVVEGGGRGPRSGAKSPCSIARRRYGLGKLQTKLCRSSMDVMPHVQTAATLAAQTCKAIFQQRRWNCSSIDTAPFLSPDLTRATREQAYVYAISSAALTYTMARACASGELYQCACAVPPKEPPMGDFKWGGCGDNIQWGMHFAKRFVDNAERQNVRPATVDVDRDERKTGKAASYSAAINLHNNRIGRKAIIDSLITQCKCHGVSGSCSIKTCWRASPDLRDVGERLLRLFTNAKELEKSKLVYTNDIPEVPARRHISDSLVFLTKSPDYCTRDERLGSLGTTGRQCNVTSNGTDGCRQLCCGRGYRTVVEEKIERCQCKYYYCCYVKCKTCRSLTQRYECS